MRIIIQCIEHFRLEPTLTFKLNIVKKFNNIIINIVSIVMMGFLATLPACKKIIDLKPQSEITDPDYWQTDKDFQLAANWFYANSLNDPSYDANMSDIAFGTAIDPISSGTYVPPAQDNNWDHRYSEIRNANKLIEEGEASSIRKDILSYLGEGYFFRAYNYFTLLKLYSGVPIINKVLLHSDPEVFAARASREELVDSILSDVDKAIIDLPVKSVADKGRICQEAAKAFKARICLFEGTWRKFHGAGDGNELLDQAISASRDVIDSNPILSTRVKEMKAIVIYLLMKQVKIIPNLLLQKSIGIILTEMVGFMVFPGETLIPLNGWQICICVLMDCPLASLHYLKDRFLQNRVP